MPTSVTMPQLGETVVEGTITKWLKQEGDRIERDEPLFEISTDKVDTEVPSPVAGTIAKILVPEGETVSVGTELAQIEEGEGQAGAPAEEAGEAGEAGEAAEGSEQAEAGRRRVRRRVRRREGSRPPPLRLPLARRPRKLRPPAAAATSSPPSSASWPRSTRSTCPASRARGRAGGSPSATSWRSSNRAGLRRQPQPPPRPPRPPPASRRSPSPPRSAPRRQGRARKSSR